MEPKPFKTERHELCAADKAKVIFDLRSNTFTQTEIAAKWEISGNQVCNLKRKAHELVDQNGNLLVDPSLKHLKGAMHPRIEEFLLEWFNCMRARHMPIDGNAIRTQAVRAAKKMNIDEFCASSGRLTRFKNRYNIKFKHLRGEIVSANVNAVEPWINEVFIKIIREYAPDDIYNADEAAIYFRKLPDCSFVSKNDPARGSKKEKEKVSLLLCTNMTGTEKLQPLVIGKYASPRCLKNIKNLPCQYGSNVSSWMTRKIFENWLHNWNIKLKKKNSRIALIIDNCSCHLSLSTFSNIQIFLLPPNTTSILQPLDQGIIALLNCHYRKLMSDKIGDILSLDLCADLKKKH